MLSLILSALSAAFFSAGVLTAPVDTINHYVIDNKPVENFDGSQLEGRLIKSYSISVITDDPVSPSKVYRIHDILTEQGSKPAQPLYIIDGEAATEADFQDLDPKSIESLTVLKGNSAQAYEKYGNTANGVIDVKLKATGTFTPSGQKINSVRVTGTAKQN